MYLLVPGSRAPHKHFRRLVCLCPICDSDVQSERFIRICGVAYASSVVSMSSFWLNTAVSDAHHRFIPEESDWGFTLFAKLHELRSIKPGTRKSIIQHDSTNIVVYMRTIKDTTGVLWHDFVESAF